MLDEVSPTNLLNIKITKHNNRVTKMRDFGNFQHAWGSRFACPKFNDDFYEGPGNEVGFPRSTEIRAQSRS